MSLIGSAAIGKRPSTSNIIECKSSLSLVGNSLQAYGYTAQIGSCSNLDVVWYNDYAAAIGQAFDILHSYAVAGSTIEQMIDTQLPQALADNSDAVWLESLVNNFNPDLANNDSIATIAEQLDLLIGPLAAKKSLVIANECTPVLAAGTIGAKTRAAEFQMGNAALQMVCDQYPNVLCNKIYNAMLDTTSATLDPISGTVDPTDGVHRKTLGAALIGRKAWENFGHRIRVTPYATKQAVTLPDWSGTGGTATAGSGSITGTPPVGWTCQVFSGAAAITITSLAPDKIRFAITNAAGASTIFIYPSKQALVLANFKKGDTFQGGFAFQASNISDCTRITPRIRLNNGTMIDWSAAGSSPSELTTPVNPETIFASAGRFTPPFTMTGNPTIFDFILSVNFAGAGTLTLDISSPTLYKILRNN